MVKKICLIIYFLLIFGEVGSAQSVGAISENIKLLVTKGLSLKKIGGNIDFGDVIATNSKQWRTIKPNNGARFVVTGYANRKVTINYTRNVTLNNNKWVNDFGGSKSNMRFISHVRRTGKNSSYTNPRRVRNGRRYKLENSNGIGKLYLWVGGRIKIKANQPEGKYIGIFSITVAY